jgi:hypothetical protein
MADAGFAVADVVIKGDPTAVIESVVGNGDDAAVGENPVKLKPPASGQHLAGPRLELFTCATVLERRRPVVQNVSEVRAGFQNVVGNGLDLAERRVSGEQPEIGIPDAGSSADAFEKILQGAENIENEPPRPRQRGSPHSFC